MNIFFTEIFEIDEDNGDVTSEHLKQLVTLAKQIEKPIMKRQVPLCEEELFEEVYQYLNVTMKNDVIARLQEEDKHREHDAKLLKEKD